MLLIKTRISESIETKKKILEDDYLLTQIQNVADMIVNALFEDKKVLLCGNGGSASDALHITGELVGRFQKERKAMAAICLNADVATMTAIANDYSFDEVYAREVEGLLQKGDILIGISTSGNSENVYRALERAKRLGGKAIALLGKGGGKIKGKADISIVVPDDNTARIQESHIMIGHILCELVENEYVKREA